MQAAYFPLAGHKFQGGKGIWALYNRRKGPFSLIEDQFLSGNFKTANSLKKLPQC